MPNLPDKRLPGILQYPTIDDLNLKPLYPCYLFGLLSGIAIGYRRENNQKGVHIDRFVHPQSVRQIVRAGLERDRGEKFRGVRDARDKNIYVLHGRARRLRFALEVSGVPSKKNCSRLAGGGVLSWRFRPFSFVIQEPLKPGYFVRIRTKRKGGDRC